MPKQKPAKAAAKKKDAKPPRGERGNRYNSKYLWDEWLVKGKTKRLKRGKDYEVSSMSMGQQVRQAASKLGLSVRVTETDDGIKVEVADA